MVLQALAPGGAEGVVFGTGEQRGVFARDIALVIVAIERPSLELAARQCALVHQRVERMLVVIALFADGMKASDEIGF